MLGLSGGLEAQQVKRDVVTAESWGSGMSVSPGLCREFGPGGSRWPGPGLAAGRSPVGGVGCPAVGR